MKNPTVLVVDDDPIVRTLVSKMLRVRNIDVYEAANGKAAAKMFDSGALKFAVIVSDLNMPEMNGIELLKHVRQESQIPFIVFTGLTEVSESQQAFALGASEFLTKPIDKDGVQKIVAIFNKEVHNFGEIELKKEFSFEDFREIKIEDFLSSSTLISDIYIKLSRTKFVKIARKGDISPRDRLSYYRDKKIEFLYVLSSDFNLYLSVAAELTSKVIASKSIHDSAKMTLLQTSTKLMVEHCFLASEIDKSSIQSAQQVVDNALKFAGDQPAVFERLMQINTHSNRLYAHSVAVSLFASLLAREHGWDSESTLTRVALGGLLHDIGKKDIPVEVLNKSRKNLTREEAVLLESHCDRGRDILMSVKGLPEEVALIAMNHHECRTGAGYPRRLKGEQISPLVRMVSVVDKFCSLIMPSSSAEMPISAADALKRMELFYKDDLDPIFFARLIELCKKSGNSSGEISTLGGKRAS